jgi:3-dehydroquinate synthase II
VARERVAIAPAAESPDERRAIVERSRRRGFSRFVVTSADEFHPKVGEVAYLRGPTDLTPVRPLEGGPIPLVAVHGPEDLPAALVAGRSAGAVAVLWSAERVIPLENLLADAHGRYQAWVIVDRLRDVPAMLGALEHGADTVVVEVRDVAMLEALEASLESASATPIPWTVVSVRRVVPSGLGDRVIVDTTSLLRPEEGLLVGSSAAFLAHVASEAVGSRFTRPRPFRVNAGAAHSYTLLADGTTRYLSELVAGDAVLVATPQGPARSVRVGRIKIERRPLVLVELEHGGRAYTVFLQEAETVRLSGESERIPTTQIAAGARVFGAEFPPGRHMGGVVEETIEER